MYNFENDMYEMIRKVEFEPVRTEFQRKMSEDLRSIKNSKKIFVSADKTRNMYAITPEEYDKLLQDNVTKTYKKTNPNVVERINKEASKITDKLKLSDRVQCIAKKPAFITIKDHKPNFPNDVACRLLNPCKSEVGRISKQYLEGINKVIRETTGVNQWRNSEAVIDWFKAIPNKQDSRFIKFDIVSFYPSICREVLVEAIAFAQTYTTVTDEMKDAILNSRKSFLYFKDDPWIKKGTANHFDVTEGSFDGAEICELVGLFLLSKLQELLSTEAIGLYRDDGLAVVHKYSGPQMDRLRKRIVDIFKRYGFKITISINLTTTDFLDLNLDLQRNKFFPYKKPNDTPVYVHNDSNHPRNILKQLPKMTGERLSNLSCNKEEFDRAAEEYQEILKKSGYKEKLSYSPPTRRNRRQRKRNILWYNPPFDLQVKTNIGKTFLLLIDKHFPPHHRLHKIINRKTVKISYSCMPNMASHIASHNKKVIQEATAPEVINPRRTCDCQIPDDCPFDGNCLKPACVYQADIVPETAEAQLYIGSTEPVVKRRWSDHNTSFRYERYRTKSKLSDHIWKLKDEEEGYVIRWSILKISTPYRAGSKRCSLCLWEKLFILQGDRNKMLNKRDELMNKCRHRNKFLLRNYKDRDERS